MLSFMERVKGADHQLNETDYKIVNYIEAHKENVSKESIQKLAEHLYMVPNTIIRFSRKLGYDGFAELKNQLKIEIRNHLQGKESILSFMQKSYDINQEGKLYQIAQALHQANNVICYGIGDSAPLCEMLVTRFKKSGANIHFYPHRHEVLAEIKTHIKPEDVIFLISSSGESEAILEVAKSAKNSGIKIISLTNYSENTLVNLAHMNLYGFSNPQKLGVYNMDLKAPLLFVIELLWEHYLKVSF